MVFTSSIRRAGALLAFSFAFFLGGLSLLTSAGFVPDYVDGTAPRNDVVLTEIPVVAPDSDGRLALSDVPQLGHDVVLVPLPVEAPMEGAGAPEVLAPTPLNSQETVSHATGTPRASEVLPTIAAVPEPKSSLTTLTVSEALPAAPVLTPTRLIIDELSIDVPILNPESTETSVLDNALLKGTVRYPLSARLNEEGNIFVFGHSSHLPVVRNKMFKALNGIEELHTGDTIELVGEGERHVYRVRSVRTTDASEAMIDLSHKGGKRLTLSTCDSFGGKSSRFVVEAEFIASYKVSI